MDNNFVPYSEITPRQKEFLFHFVKYIAELLSPENKKRVVYWGRPTFPLNKNGLKERSSYGLKHDLQFQREAEKRRFIEDIIFKDFPDFDFFYCRNDTFMQAMLDCKVKYKKSSCKESFYFLGGFNK